MACIMTSPSIKFVHPIHNIISWSTTVSPSHLTTRFSLGLSTVTNSETHVWKPNLSLHNDIIWILSDHTLKSDHKQVKISSSTYLFIDH